MGINTTCFQFEAVDDQIVEYTEVFVVAVDTVADLDQVEGNSNTTTVSILDNDGEQKIHDIL